MWTHVIFDLDGTLLNTLEDLANATNWVCAQHGWPVHELDEYKRFVGNGARKLMERAAPADIELTKELLDQLYQEFNERYADHKAEKTRAYDGMPQAVKELGRAGLTLAVLTNKPDVAAGPIVEQYYPDSFSVVQGALPGVPVKPDPALLCVLMERIGAKPETTLFVGDSDVDIMTAKNGGLESCGVLWGFRSREELIQAGADHLVESAAELMELILK